MVVAILLVIVILLQRTGNDGLTGIGGNNMGVASAESISTFLSRTTITLGSIFLINAIVLANLSSKKNLDTTQTIKPLEVKKQETNVPIAK
jgi:preprotein translocase subunit SecG